MAQGESQARHDPKRRISEGRRGPGCCRHHRGKNLSLTMISSHAAKSAEPEETTVGNLATGGGSLILSSDAGSRPLFLPHASAR